MEAPLQLKSEMRLTTMAVWIFVAVSCAALPFLHAVPALTRGSSGDLWPLLLAVLIGLVACIALSVINRQVLGAEPPSPDIWASLSPGAAALFGLASWGVPVGLLFTVDNFLRSKSFSVLTSSAVIWPLAGLAFGLVMRWTSQWGKKKSQA
jgi:hypothetical protein